MEFLTLLKHGASEITDVFQLPGKGEEGRNRAVKEESSVTGIWIKKWMILWTASAGQKKESLRLRTL